MGPEVLKAHKLPQQRRGMGTPMAGPVKKPQGLFQAKSLFLDQIL